MAQPLSGFFYCLYFGCKLAFRALALSGPVNMTQISERFLVQAHLDAILGTRSKRWKTY